MEDMAYGATDVTGINSNTIEFNLVTGEENDIDWAKIAVRLFICIAGILGNLLVIFVIVILQEYKKAVTHWYVLQLAIADSIFLLTLPFKVDEDIHNEWRFAAGMCKAKETILFLNYYASIMFLMIMSIDRYIAVCHGFSDILQKLRSHSSAYIITVCTWIIALIMCIPIMLYSNKAGIDPNCKCTYEFPKYVMTPEEYCESEQFKPGTTAWDACITVSSAPVNPSACKDPTVSIDFGSGGFDLTSLYDSLSYDNMDVEHFAYGVADDNVTITSLESYDGEVLETNRDDLIGAECHYWDKGTAWTGYLVFNFVCLFIIPFLVMVFCYTMIVRKLQETKLRSESTMSNAGQSVSSTSGFTSSGRRKRQRSAASSRANSERNRVTIMCAVLVFLFVMCWLPFHAIHMAKIKGIMIHINDEKWCSLLPTIASLIAYMNSALNPYLYNFLGTRFGRRLRQIKEQKSVKGLLASVRKHSSSGGHTHSEGTTYAKTSARTTQTTAAVELHRFKSDRQEEYSNGASTKLMMNEESSPPSYQTVVISQGAQPPVYANRLSVELLPLHPAQEGLESDTIGGRSQVLATEAAVKEQQ